VVEVVVCIGGKKAVVEVGLRLKTLLVVAMCVVAGLVVFFLKVVVVEDVGGCTTLVRATFST